MARLPQGVSAMAKAYHGWTLSMIQRGQAWKRRERSELGSHIFRVMAVSDGWVMLRVKGCNPDVVFWKDLVVKFDRVPAFDQTGKS